MSDDKKCLHISIAQIFFGILSGLTASVHFPMFYLAV
jgi:hypothetical protein